MTTKICPFISTMVNKSGVDEFVEKLCVESDCQVWDSINSRCGALVSDILIHDHNSHSHPRSHTCMQSKNLLNGQYYNYCGGGTYNQIITKATLLLNEFIFGEDTDGNDLIYGIDFMIVGDGKPAILEQIEHMEQWMDPECKITWQQYQDWIDNLDDPEYDPFQNGTCGGNGGEE